MLGTEKHAKLWLCFVVMMVGLQGGPALAHKADAHPLKALMQNMFFSLQTVYKSTLKSSRWRQEADRQKIDRAFQQLEENANKLGEHMTHDLVFGYIGSSLSKDINQAYHLHKQGAHAQAGFIVRHMIENCYACHSKYPQKGPFNPNFLTSQEEAALDHYELSHLKIATRQFDQAVVLLEALLTDPVYPLEDLLLHGVPLSYLKLMLLVKKDAERAYTTMVTLARLKPAAAYKATLAQWQADLREARAQEILGKKPDLAFIKAYLDQGEVLEPYARQDRWLVRSVMAERMLQAIVADPASGVPVRAEAYHLLANLEDALGSSFWLSEAQYYWEAAIRSYPHSPMARTAYQELEQRTIIGYSGSGGVHIPDDVQGWLKELRALR